MIQVAVGIIKSGEKILIAKRKAGKHLASYWEFPGGKIEESESPEVGLKRELLEKLGIEVVIDDFFMDSNHKYSDKTILLKSYLCSIKSGDIILNDHDKIEWVSTSDLIKFEFAPVDIPLVTALVNETKFNNTVYSFSSFLEIEVATWGERLKNHISVCMNEEAGYSQRKAWFDCFTILREQLNKLSKIVNFEKAKVIFEYEIPRERGRRPDVLILSGDNLLVLEFKGYSNENKAQIDQAKHYARDLKNYHEKSHDLNVSTFLVLAAAKNINKVIDNVYVVSGDLLSELLSKFISGSNLNVREWFNSEYAPLPNLIQSAQLIFRENKFPQIKKASSAGIPETLKELKNIVVKADDNKTHHLVLISGVPGAGKTLVGIQFVFETYIQDIMQKAVLLSGNGPLVNVLQYSLGNTNFVQSVHGFLKEYAHSTKIPSEDVFIYDEAQRAWDSDKVAQSRRIGSNSEPTDFIKIAGKKDHCLIIGLIGDGQEIHLGEESGLSLWSEAIAKSDKNWNIHCPKKYKSYFENLKIEENEVFNLTTSLRTHQALALQKWVKDILDDDLASLKHSAKALIKEEYPMYITRDLNTAKNYLIEKYKGEEAKTYGVIASSKSKVLPRYGVKNDYNSTKKFTPAQYYVDKNNDAYCTKFNSVVTEFACQGLELDMPIVAWDKDFVYNEKWQDRFPNQKAKNSFELRKNSYRVLLTRGRDGLIIFIPEESDLNMTYNLFKNNGCEVLL